jgi:hypothetical protein
LTSKHVSRKRKEKSSRTSNFEKGKESMPSIIIHLDDSPGKAKVDGRAEPITQRAIQGRSLGDTRKADRDELGGQEQDDPSSDDDFVLSHRRRRTNKSNI